MYHAICVNYEAKVKADVGTGYRIWGKVTAPAPAPAKYPSSGCSETLLARFCLGQIFAELGTQQIFSFAMSVSGLLLKYLYDASLFLFHSTFALKNLVKKKAHFFIKSPAVVKSTVHTWLLQKVPNLR